jgi:hypothetical protein
MQKMNLLLKYCSAAVAIRCIPIATVYEFTGFGIEVKLIIIYDASDRLVIKVKYRFLT